MTFTRVLTDVINKFYSRIGTLCFRYAAINFVYDINSCQLLKNIFLQYESQKSFES